MQNPNQLLARRMRKSALEISALVITALLLIAQAILMLSMDSF